MTFLKRAELSLNVVVDKNQNGNITIPWKIK